VVAVALATTPVSLGADRWARFAATLLAGMVPLSLLGIALGYWASPKGALPLANVLYLGLAFGGGLWTRPPDLPRAVAEISPYLPTRLWGEILWPAVDGRPWAPRPWLGLAGYTLVFGLVAAWGYRRDEGEQWR
jgi:ABC-2 type transport system permease protein